MNRSWKTHSIGMLILAGIFTTIAFAETLEITTFYPSPPGSFNSLVVNPGPVVVGANALPDNAQPNTRVYVQGPDDAQGFVSFMPGADTPAAGTPEIRFGIGTTIPLRTLHVNTDVARANRPHGVAIFSADLLDNVGIELRDTDEAVDAGGNRIPATPYIDFGNDDGPTFDMRLSLTGDDSLAIEGGNLGIGTAAPTGTLHVVGGTASDGASGIPITLQAQSGGAGDTNGGNILLLPGEGSGTGTAGRVGVGTSAPEQRLTVVGGNAVFRRAADSRDEIVIGSADPNQGIELRSGTRRGTPHIDFSNDADIDFDMRLRLTRDNVLAIEGGNVGINRLDVNGQIQYGVSQSFTTAVSSITFSDLNGNQDENYEIVLVGRVTPPALSYRRVFLRPNGTSANTRNMLYRFWTIGTGLAAVSGWDFFRVTDEGLVLADNGPDNANWRGGADILIRATLSARTGMSRIVQGTYCISRIRTTTDRELRGDTVGWWNQTATNITSLVIDFDGATFTGKATLRILRAST